MSIDLREFRNVLGQFATGIAIVTTTVDGNRLGATISSFNSVSLDPTLVLFSLASKSLGIAQWKAATALTIFILGACPLFPRGTGSEAAEPAPHAATGVPSAIRRAADRVRPLASFSRLWAVHTSAHSPRTFSTPRSKNWRKPRPSLI